LHKGSRQRTSLLQSFNFAFEGIIHVLRTQRNMRIHFFVAFLVLGGALLFDLTRLEIVALFVAITFVLITEMMNSALESAIDIFTSRYDPLAKVAKDVAAGAVLIAAINAMAVAYVVFYDKLMGVPYTVLSKVRGTPLHVTIIAFVLLIFVVIAVKALTHRGTPLHGGMPSGHAAIAFGGWVAITFIASGTAFALAISMIALLMAILTAQSRVQANIHSEWEVVLGALLGVGLTLIVFQVWYPI
jgi:diacylglycerol kinase (ATP)